MPIQPRRPMPVEPPTQIIRPVEPPTEIIPVVLAEPAFDDAPVPPPPPRPGRRRAQAKPKDTVGLKIIRTAGEVLVTLGLVVLLFVVYEVWWTDLVSAGKQDDVTHALDDDWQRSPTEQERTEHFSVADGQGMAKLYIPVLGPDFKFTIVEGTTERDLAIGPGHYKDSALPGAPGNFAVAGHRVGKGAPFNDLGLLAACDAIIIETRANWYVYRMLPTPDDAKAWSKHASDPRCAGGNGAGKVEPMTGEYAAAVGRQIVTPHESDVVAPVPGNLKAKTPPAQRRKMITLTTCHPKFSNKQRMVLHGVLVRAQAKDPAKPGALPVEMQEGS